jgi:hypothetical protein
MRRFAVIILLLGLGLPGLNSPLAQNPRISEWVEQSSITDDSRIALGYPVPIPVDTPLPFDGFRTYNGLHMRHQDLANTSPWSHALQVGQTHNGRTIWAYQLGDADHLTPYGVPEQAMLTNGGIHAREWQSPEVATGIIELLSLAETDHHLISYLRDSANVLVIPVLNVDGFLQTQRYPRNNWMGTDPDDPDFSPRDGRMRRKNMLGPDEDLLTVEDHLLGVDLNRNNAPYWNTNQNSSSDDTQSIVHHGAFPHSEPETQALETTAQLGPAQQLSMYTDMHSFSQVHFWTRNNNSRLAGLTQRLLSVFTNHHVNFDAHKNYAYTSAQNTPVNQGIGTTDEYFTHQYQVPSWTLEIEPTNGASYHAPLPGSGADYGGLARNGHDGFILPDSEVERVRTELAQTFSIAYYHQTAPPSIVAARLTDTKTGAVVFAAEWDVTSATSRELYTFQSQALQTEREYNYWLAFDKPMRWRSEGAVSPLPGQASTTLDVDANLIVGHTPLTTTTVSARWLDLPDDSTNGYLRYRDDALSIDFTIPVDANNQGVVNGTVQTTVSFTTTGMTGTRIDADPATVARWEDGGWSGYEDTNGNDLNGNGGADQTLQFEVTSDDLGDPFVIEPGISAAWYDPQRDGEGFMLEILPDKQALMYWFTYTADGEQDWFFAQGEVVGNRIVFPELLRVDGGEFGPGFDPDKVTRTVIGSASFIWSDCSKGAMEYLIDSDGGPRRQGRIELSRLTDVMSLDCSTRPPRLSPEIPQGQLSGSWYDPTHSGEGFVLEVLFDKRVLVFWFSYDPEGNRRWFYGVGEIQGAIIRFDEMYTTSGGIFGPDYDKDQVDVVAWGSLELELSCLNGTARFTSSEEGFPPGTLNLDRLTLLEGLSCD